MHYVYLIESESAAGVRYAGCTDDLRQRLADHNAGKSVSLHPIDRGGCEPTSPSPKKAGLSPSNGI